MRKRVLCGIAWLLAAMIFSGCNLENLKDEVMQDIAQDLTEPEDIVEPFIGFYTEDVEDLDLLEKPDLTHLADYQSEYAQYNSHIYFDALNENEQLIYRTYEYALDHSYPYIWIDQRLMGDVIRDSTDILWFLSLDTPMVEQNLYYETWTLTMTHTLAGVETAKEEYFCLYIRDFEAERMDRKLQALAEAEKIVAQMPEDLTDTQKALYYYDYLGNNVTYEKGTDEDEYLYRALCLHKTNCDGFANAMSLLCSLSGPKGFEKMSTPPDGSEGHTWNALFLDGYWVNVDATGANSDVTSECGYRREERIYFGFPDVLQSDVAVYTDMFPACTEENPRITYIFSGQIEGFTDIVKTAFAANEEKFAVLLVDVGDLEDQITDEFATELDRSLHYIHYETAEGKTVYYIFDSENDE